MNAIAMIVTCAVCSIDSQELDVTWSQMEFDHEPHHSTGIKLINASEELIEALEDNQVQRLRESWLAVIKITLFTFIQPAVVI